MFFLHAVEELDADEAAEAVLGAGVLEVAADHRGDTFRAVYTFASQTRHRRPT